MGRALTGASSRHATGTPAQAATSTETASALGRAARASHRSLVALRGFGRGLNRLNGWGLALALAGLAVVVRIPFLFVRHELVPGSDSGDYLRIANALGDGDIPTDGYRPPGYPAFVAALDFFPGRIEDNVALVQHALGVVAVVLVVLAGTAYFGKAVAGVAGFLTAVSPPGIALEELLLPDFLFGFLALTGALVLAHLITRRQFTGWRLLALGVLFGVTIYVKPSGQFLVAGALVAILTAAGRARRGLGAVALISLAALATILPWIAHNVRYEETAAVSTQGGQVLFNRAFEVGSLSVPIDTDEGQIVAEIVEAAPVGSRPNSWVANELVRQGLLPREATGLMGKLARAAILDRPFSYAVTAKDRFVAFVAFLKEPDSVDYPVRTTLAAIRPPLADLPLASWRMLDPVLRSWFVLSLGGLAVPLVLISRSPSARGAAGAFLAVWLAFSLGTVLSHGGMQRYSASLAYFVWLLGSAGVALMLDSLQVAVRGAPPWTPLLQGTPALSLGARAPASAKPAEPVRPWLGSAKEQTKRVRAGWATGLGFLRKRFGRMAATTARLRPAILWSAVKGLGVPFGYSGLALLASALVVPLWTVIIVPLPGVSLTVGRLATLLIAGLLVLDLATGRLSLRRPWPPALVVVGGLMGLGGWMAVSTFGWGCRCLSEVGGYAEVAAIASLGILIATSAPRFTLPLVAASTIAALSAALLALLGVDPPATSEDLSATGGRLSGTYGNANFLAFAVAFAAPILLAFRAWLGTAVAACGGALVIVAVGLSYSRAGVLAALAGVVVVLALQAPSRKALLRGGLAIALALAVLGLVYPVFDDYRRQVSFRSLDPAGAQYTSGWDGTARGFIGSPPAEMKNFGTSLEVSTDQPLEGVSHPFDRPARRGGTYRVTFRARSTEGPFALAYALQDDQLGARPSSDGALIGTRWRDLTLGWRPSRRSELARMYFWQRAGDTGFQLSDITLERAEGSRVTRERVDTALGTSQLQAQQAMSDQAERRYLSSRADGARLALASFVSDPLLGIGWGNFPLLADRRLGYGRLPTHNDYLRVAAELGVPGIALLLLIMVGVVTAARRRPESLARTAALGALATGAVGLLFVNALVASPAAIPLALALASLTGSEHPPNAGP